MNRAERLTTILAIASGVIGVILGAMKVGEVIESRVEHQEARQTTKTADAPRFDVQYVSVTGQVMVQISAGGGGHSFLYPLLNDEVADAEALRRWGASNPGDSARLTFLSLQNVGKGDAHAVRLDVDRLEVPTGTLVTQQVGGEDSVYALTLRAAATAQRTVSFAIPTTLKTGDGFFIPLFFSRDLVDDLPIMRTWRMQGGIVYLPTKVRFTDAAGAEYSIPIRGMRDPLVLENGIEIGG